VARTVAANALKSRLRAADIRGMWIGNELLASLRERLEAVDAVLKAPPPEAVPAGALRPGEREQPPRLALRW
jgi:hypothetical protein